MSKLQKYFVIFTDGTQEDFYTKNLKNAKEYAGKLAKKYGRQVKEVFTTA